MTATLSFVRALKPYIALTGARYRVLLQYRAAALAGFGTQLFWGLIRVMVFEAFYRSTTAVQPMTYSQTVTYLWLIQAMLLLIPWSVDSELRTLIRSGAVVYELLRPTDLYWFWYSRAVAGRIAPVMLRCIPLFVVAGLFFELQPPVSWAAATAWLVATGGAVLLSCAVTNLLAISMLWTVSGDGAMRLLAVMATLLSGSIVPLPFFPEWSQPILAFLPFRGLMDTPFRLYTGHLPPEAVFGVVGHQLAWTAALVLLGRWLLRRGTHRMVIQGG
jgi:ABC-2 type transport system permease protein